MLCQTGWGREMGGYSSRRMTEVRNWSDGSFVKQLQEREREREREREMGISALGMKRSL